MFDRFNWFIFDPALYFEDSSSRWSRGQQLANAWSVWTDLSKQYQIDFQQGDEAAIQKFARRSNYVLSAPWVLAVLQHWQAEATPAAKQKIGRVIAAWLDSRGKRAPKKLFDTIRRDKRVECEVLALVLQKKTKEVALAEVSGSTGENENIVQEIHREYWNRQGAAEVTWTYRARAGHTMYVARQGTSGAGMMVG